MPRRYVGPGAKFIYRKSVYAKRRLFLLVGLLVVLIPTAILVWLNRSADRESRTAPTPPPLSRKMTGADWGESFQEWNDARNGTRRETNAPPIDYSHMVLVEAGWALIGSDDNSRGEEKRLPFDKRFVDAFYIDRTEVTNADYALCVNAKACSLPQDPEHMIGYDQPDHPVIVNYKQALRYCTWAGKRLPAEIEWEKAARGTDGRLYPWGDAPPDSSRGNVCGTECPVSTAMADWQDEYPFTAPVGSFPEGDTPSGLSGMAGNVREWVVGETVEMEGHFVSRGASWCSRDFEMMGSHRHIWYIDVRIDDMGVRCVADVPEAK